MLRAGLPVRGRLQRRPSTRAGVAATRSEAAIAGFALTFHIVANGAFRYPILLWLIDGNAMGKAPLPMQS